MWSRWLKHISFDSCQTGRPSKHCQHVQTVCSVFKLCVFFSFCDIRVWGRSLKHISFDSCRTRRPLKHCQHVQTVCSVFKLCLFLILWHRGVKSIADRQVYAGFVWKLLSTCVLSCSVVHVVYSFSKTLHKFLQRCLQPLLEWGDLWQLWVLSREDLISVFVALSCGDLSSMPWIGWKALKVSFASLSRV